MKISGKPFKVDILDVEELKAGTAELPWMPEDNTDHPALSGLEPAVKLGFMKQVLGGMLPYPAADASVMSDEWNRIFPDYKFSGADEFLTGAWAGNAWS